MAEFEECRLEWSWILIGTLGGGGRDSEGSRYPRSTGQFWNLRNAEEADPPRPRCRRKWRSFRQGLVRLLTFRDGSAFGLFRDAVRSGSARRSASFIRDCQPGLVALKEAKISGSIRSLMSCLTDASIVEQKPHLRPLKEPKPLSRLH